MELRRLRHVVALARHLHYKRAADELGLTQPALSRSIQVAESIYGAKLFDRDRSGVHLTPFGTLFVARAEALLRDAVDFEKQVRRYAGGEDGRVAFGISPSSARACLPQLLRELAAERPRIEVNVAVRRTSVLVSMLLEEEIEFLICSRNEMPRTASVRSEKLGVYSACILVRSGHPLLADPNLDISQFPIVATGPFEEGDKILDGLFTVFGARPRMSVESTETLARLTETSDAVWMSSTLGAADELARGALVKLGRGVADHPIDLRLYSLRNRSAPPIVADVRDRLRRIVNRP